MCHRGVPRGTRSNPSGFGCLYVRTTVIGSRPFEALEDSLAALLSVRMRRRASEGDRDFADVGSQRLEDKVAGDSDALIDSAVPSSAFSASGARSWALRGGIQGVGDRESAGAPERGQRIGCGRECLSPRSRPCLDHGIRLAPLWAVVHESAESARIRASREGVQMSGGKGICHQDCVPRLFVACRDISMVDVAACREHWAGCTIEHLGWTATCNRICRPSKRTG